VSTLATAPATQAHIVCHDNYQVVAGQEISTLHCQDNTLAQVAHVYGRRVSDAEVRNNTGLKNELCRYLG